MSPTFHPPVHVRRVEASDWRHLRTGRVWRARANRSPRPTSGLPVASLGGMSRPPRIEIANGSFHVVARGNERKPIYRDATDPERFLEILQLVVERYRWRVLCYCLMTNHYH